MKKKIIIMAGGSGGHVFPGLEIANYFIKKKWIVHWLGTKNKIESILVPKNGIAFNAINVSSFCNQNMKKKILSLIHFFISYFQTRKIIKKFKPHIVLGMGGYVSGPGALAAWSLGIPVVLHEQNIVSGLTNKLFSKISNKMLQAFPGAFSNANIVGNPIRNVLLNLPTPEQRFLKRQGPLRVLVIGGSQGASILNKLLPKVANLLGKNITIWHQTGNIEFNKVKKDYQQCSTLYKLNEFIHDIEKAYIWSDIMICRSGALTVSEIAAVGIPAIFIPFEHKDRQQYLNASLLVNIGAAKLFNESQVSAEKLANTLNSLDRFLLKNMAEKARSMATYNATEKIFLEIEKIFKI